MVFFWNEARSSSLSIILFYKLFFKFSDYYFLYIAHSEILLTVCADQLLYSLGLIMFGMCKHNTQQ